MKTRLIKAIVMLNDYVDHDLNLLQKILVIIDLILSIIIYGAGISDYYQYKFYKRRHIDRKDFVVYRKRMRLVKKYNDKASRKYFDQKDQFNQAFSEYIGREWLNPSKATVEEFFTFIAERKRFIVKPVQGSHGLGIKIINNVKPDSVSSLYEKLKNEGYIIEEIIVQNKELEAFNPGTINTIRIVSLLDSSAQVHLVTATLRIGRGEKIADNFHHDGIAALIDINSGVVVSCGVDKKMSYYIHHPVTEKQIIGFIIPHWDEIKEFISKAAKEIPSVRYVGWDVAVGEKGQLFLLEGNFAADPDISQMPDQVGKWPLLKEIIRV